MDNQKGIFLIGVIKRTQIHSLLIMIVVIVAMALVGKVRAVTSLIITGIIREMDLEEALVDHPIEAEQDLEEALVGHPAEAGQDSED
jgi:hypothetical protein